MNQQQQQDVRASYSKDIQAIVPLDDIEKRDIEMALSWLKSAAHVNKPYDMKEHLGVMCLVLSPDRRQTFLLNHRKAQMWLPPGGHVDAGLTFQQAMELEMQEETGQDATLILPTPFFLTRVLTQGLNAGHIDVTVWYLLEAPSDVAYAVMQKEASEVRWFPLEALGDMPAASNLPRVYTKLLIWLAR
jgi:8-oxo-dGTP pyrophosphatase MutT (NUDIX family)